MTSTDAHHGRIDPETFAWSQYPDPHERPTSPVRVLRAAEPFLIEADFAPDFHAGLHWHPHDTIYLMTAGEMRIGDEGRFGPGSLRWVKAGHVYGPEEAGPHGVRFHLFSLGGDIGLNWADLHEVPAALPQRLGRFRAPAGRRDLSTAPLWEPGQRTPTHADMPDEGPLVFRLRLGAAAAAAPVAFPFPWMLFITQGELRVDGVGAIGPGEFYWARAGVSATFSAGAEGACGVVISTEERDVPGE